MLKRKAKVIIWDINETKIIETILELSNKGRVFGFKVDVSDVKQIVETSKRVKKLVGVVDVLINNAGIVIGKYFHEHSMVDILKTMKVNAIAPIYGE